MSRKLPASINMAAAVEGQPGDTENKAGIRIDLHIGFYTKSAGGSITIETCWQAEVWALQNKKWLEFGNGKPDAMGRRKGMYKRVPPVFLGTFVSNEGETPADLLKMLGTLYAQGEVSLTPPEDGKP